MNFTPSTTGYEHILVFIALQGAEEGVVASEYSGSVRLADYVAPEAFIKKCIAAWLQYASGLPIPGGELTISLAIPESGDVEDIFVDMLAKGYITYDTVHDVCDFSSLNRVFGYVITSEANIPDWGIIAWGVDGIGATYASSDLPPVLFDPGVTEADYLAQFPQHGISGSDIILVYPGSNALPRLIEGWKPQIKDMIAAIRVHVPVVIIPPSP